MHEFSSLTISALYAIACLGWRILITSVFAQWHQKADIDGLKSLSMSTSIANAFLIGSAVVSALLIALGLCGQLRPLPVMFILLPGIVGLPLGRQYFHGSIDQALNALIAFRAMPLWVRMIGFSIVVLALGCAIGAWILPPNGDAVAFYMVYPKIIAATGTLEPMHGPYYFFSTIGLPVELHYAALMALADEHAAKFLMFPIAISTGVMLAGIVRLCGGRTTAVTLAWAMLFSSYTFHHYIYDGKVDLAAAAYGLAAVFWLLRGTVSRISVPACALAGWFAGLATMAKFSYLLALGVSLFVLFSWQFVIRRSLGASFRSVIVNLACVGVVMASAAIVAWLPQFLKNWALFGAPLAPFIGGPAAGNLLNQVWFSPADTGKILLTYPFALVFGRYPMQGGGLSLLFLAFVPFLLWLPYPKSWRESSTIAVTVAALSGVLAWMVLRPSVIAPRYILTSLVLFVPILAIAVERVLEDRTTQRFLRMGTTITVVLAIGASFWHLLPIPSVIFSGASFRDNVCSQPSPECEAFSKLAKTADPSERILIASYYPYWLNADQLQCRDTLEEQREIPDQGQLLSWLGVKGFRYVVVDPSVAMKLHADLQQLSEIDTSEVEALNGGRELKIYRIKSDIKAKVRCVETAPKQWHLQRDQL